MSHPQPGKMDVTLVAYYGDKPPLIAKLICDAISELRCLLGNRFVPYTLQQVHGTIIGLEGYRVERQIINTNYAALHKEPRIMDLKAALRIIRESTLLPFDVTIGGFIDGAPYSFTSRGVAPYLRSFSIQGQNIVVMGWPYNNGKYSNSINQLRRSFNTANVLHKYHASPVAEDNDFFFVLGNVLKECIDPMQLQDVQSQLRALFASHGPVRIPITRDFLHVVAYIDEKLVPETSCSFTLDEAERKIDLIQSLYSTKLNSEK